MQFYTFYDIIYNSKGGVKVKLSEWLEKRKEMNKEALTITKEDIDTAIKALKYRITHIENENLRERIMMEADLVCNNLEKDALKASTYCKTEIELQKTYALIIKQLTGIIAFINKIIDKEKKQSRK